jgi:hypothetical protein
LKFGVAFGDALFDGVHRERRHRSDSTPGVKIR